MLPLSVAAMDFELSEEQRAIQATARDFAGAEMMPHARDWDENEIFPVDVLHRAAVPSQFAGAGFATRPKQ